MKKNKKIILIVLLLFIVASCLDLPKMPALNKSTKKTVESVKKYLKCETISYSFTRQTKNDTTKLFLDFLIYDVKRKKPNLDSINVLLMKKFDQNDFKLKDCYRINFFYFKDYDDAKLVKGFRFNSDGVLIEEFYE